MQPPFKLTNSKWCSVSSLTLIEYSSSEQRLWSDCAYAQAGLSLCWSHIVGNPMSWLNYHYCIFITMTFIKYFKLPISLKSNLLLCWHGFHDIFHLAPHCISEAWFYGIGWGVLNDDRYSKITHTLWCKQLEARHSANKSSKLNSLGYVSRKFYKKPLIKRQYMFSCSRFFKIG